MYHILRPPGGVPFPYVAQVCYSKRHWYMDDYMVVIIILAVWWAMWVYIVLHSYIQSICIITKHLCAAFEFNITWCTLYIRMYSVPCMHVRAVLCVWSGSHHSTGDDWLWYHMLQFRKEHLMEYSVGIWLEVNILSFFEDWDPTNLGQVPPSHN